MKSTPPNMMNSPPGGTRNEQQQSHPLGENFRAMDGGLIAMKSTYICSILIFHAFHHDGHCVTKIAR
jgi:hypothetical protein